MLQSLARSATRIQAYSGRFSFQTCEVLFKGRQRKVRRESSCNNWAASGLGKATAQEFEQHGAQVIIADTDTQLGPKLAGDLGSAAHFVECDVAVESQVAEAVDVAVSHHGKLDIIYNNAGVPGPQSIADLDLNEFDRVMEVNVRGVIAGIKHAARVMVPKGSGSILCTASIGGLMGGFATHPYSISKHSIPGIVRSVATELCQTGVRINCISPTVIPTAMSMTGIAKFFPGATEEQVIGIINGLGELAGAKCEAIGVARAALYLASDYAKYVTGHNLVVDGGFTCYKSLRFPSPDQFA